MASTLSTSPARASADESPLEPGLPIVDPHHHLWDLPPEPGLERRRYLIHELMADINASGHRITHTVFMEALAMYRADGDEDLKPVGETEFANGQAAMSASGAYGPCRALAGIISNGNLRLGDDFARVLDAHIAAGNGRLRGIRFATVHEDGMSIFGWPLGDARKGAMTDPAVRLALAHLASRGLSFDTWCFHTQLHDLAELADAAPNVTVILDHVGTPLNTGRFAGKETEVFAAWKAGMVELAKRPNVMVKLGGLAMDLSIPLGARNPLTPSDVLAQRWRPLIETSIGMFGADRCMFESNFPPDAATCSYGALWNAFKRIAANYSAAEKTALFSGTAKRIYRLNG